MKIIQRRPLGFAALFVSVFCIISTPALGLVQPPLDPVVRPNGPLGNVIHSGQIEDFERVLFTDHFGGTYVSLLDPEQYDYPLHTLYQAETYSTGVAVTQKGYDTDYFITYEDEYSLVMELDQYGVNAGRVELNRDPVTDEVRMTVFNASGNPVSEGPLAVHMQNSERGKRGFWSIFLVVVVVVMEIVDTVLEHAHEPPKPPNNPTVSNPVTMDNGDIVTTTAWPDGKSVTQIIHPDGSVTTTEYDPAKVPPTTVTFTPPPEQASKESEKNKENRDR